GAAKGDAKIDADAVFANLNSPKESE
ncbi:FIG00741505: hypothetical protein, partial [hydrothermal vent metagenome]